VGYFLTGYPYYWERMLFAEGLAWMVACGLTAWVLRRWQPRWASVLFCGLIFVYLLLGVGPAASLSVMFFLASAHAAGLIGLRLLYSHSRQSFGGIEALV